MKTLVICCDGTWNKPDQKAGGRVTPTNVVKLSHCLDKVDQDKNVQEVYYHTGVGTDGDWLDKFWGGAMGAGLDGIILSAYSWLCRHWEPDSRLFLFGFSRGAYTVRSLTGVIRKCGLLNLEGLPESEKWERLTQVFQTVYRQKKDPNLGLKYLPDAGPASEKVKISFLGVWDTVGSLGIPDDMGLLNLLDNPARYQFHDTDLSPQVQVSRQALAMDEMRSSFAPTKWSNVPPTADCQQIWFPGCHSDVGGGFAETGLSDGALKWMIEEAAKVGLGFRTSSVAQIQPSFQGPLHDPVEGVWAVMRTQPRNVPEVKADPPLFHPSALSRVADPPIAQAPFWSTLSVPCSVEVYAKERWNFTGVYLQAGKPYQLTSSGEWVDGDMTFNPGGQRQGGLSLGDISHVVGNLVGGLEGIFQAVFRNKKADFWGTKRVESMPWFALVGAVANENDPQKDGTPDGMEVFLIGASRNFTPTKSGYLYCFANDAWHFYDNNKGSVTLTVH